MWNIIEKISYTILNYFAKLTRHDLSDETFEKFMQFVKFGIVGVSNTVVSYVITAGSTILFEQVGLFPHTDIYIAQLIAFVISVAWSYYWNNKKVFTLQEGEHRSFWRSLLKTYVSYSFTGIFLNTILTFIWINVFHVNKLIAPLINLLVSVPLNFIINKYWAFRTDKN